MDAQTNNADFSNNEIEKYSVVYRITGQLNRDPELRQTPGGAFVTTVSLVAYLQTSGAIEPYFYDCNVFGKQAERAVAELRRGQIVTLEGTPEKKRWTSRTGEPMARLVVKVKKIDFPVSAKSKE